MKTTLKLSKKNKRKIFGPYYLGNVVKFLKEIIDGDALFIIEGELTDKNNLTNVLIKLVSPTKEIK